MIDNCAQRQGIESHPVTADDVTAVARFRQHGKFGYCSCTRWRMTSTESEHATRDSRVPWSRSPQGSGLPICARGATRPGIVYTGGRGWILVVDTEWRTEPMGTAPCRTTMCERVRRDAGSVICHSRKFRLLAPRDSHDDP
ncbi:MAG: hypothetical protein ACRDRL_03510 [Sciscionella sp.]